MLAPVSLLTLDGDLRRLGDEADFAEARYGKTYADGLRHVRDELSAVLLVAFERTRDANDLSLPRRDRVALTRHADLIVQAVAADLEQVQARFAKAVAQTTPSGPGAKAALGAALSLGRVIVDHWWEGRLRLGPLTSPAVAAQDWHTLRPLPRWVPWTVGGVAAAGAASPAVFLLLL